MRDSYTAQRQELSDLRQTVIEVAAAAAVGGALVGLLLAGRLSLRLRRAASIAERVTAGELDARIHARGHDEVAKLGEAIDRMAEAMRERIERERRFVADVAHDLRTPLTGLKTAASLLDHDQVGDAIRERVDRLLRLVEDLLEISRLDSGTATADLRWVDLGGFVASVVGNAPDVTIRTNGASQSLVDPRRLERVIENVLDNAARHGAPPVEVSVSPGRIVMRDHGPGFSEAMLASAAERFTTGDPARGDGIGLGLAIAAGQCHVLGAELDLANDPGRRRGRDDRVAPGMSARVHLDRRVAAPPGGRAAARPRDCRSRTAGRRREIVKPAGSQPRVDGLDAVAFPSTSRGWAAGRGAIIATTDGGATWTQQYKGRADIRSLAFADEQHGWAVASTSLLRTTDGGATWSPAAEPEGLVLTSVTFTSADEGWGIAFPPGGVGRAGPGSARAHR